MERKINNSSVVVIGGAGFLGSHLVNYLVEQRGCEVLVLDNLITGRREHVHPAADFQWHDIREPEDQTARLLDGADFVFNYAAEPYIPECFERPMHFFEINATAVLRVLNACQQAGIEALLQVSSAEIYGDNLYGLIDEEHPIVPHSTYGVSKAAADGLVQVRWREARVPAIALRQFNCVGERETHEYVIPEIISQLAEGPRVKLGNDSFRDFLYAGDAVRMAVELLERGAFGEVYNMGSQEGVHIYALAEMLADVMDVGPVQIVEDEARKRPWEIWHLQSDNTKLYKTIDARPEVTLHEALERTVDYFHCNGNKWAW